MNLRKRRSAPRLRPRARIFAVVAFVAVFILTACGSDVNTQLRLQEDYSGQRQFVMTMADEDAQSLNGGVDGAAQALETHTPDELTFEGIESEEEGYSATFTMNFDDVDDYKHKINALLDVSDIPEADREMDVKIDEQQLVTSIVFEEQFYNDDLMGWAADALVEEQIVSENTTVLTSGGTASVLYDGEEVETSTSLPRINFSLNDDRRFNEVAMDLEILESGDFQIAMSYLVSPEDTATQNTFVSERVQSLNDQDGVGGAVEDSGPTENHDSGNAEVREISAQFESPEAVEEGLRTLLANEQATFNATDTVGDASPDAITEYTGSHWTCEAICNPTNIQQLNGDTVYPDHWQLVDQRRGNGDFHLELNRGIPLDSLSSTTRLHFDGGMEQTFEFVLADETAEDHEDAVAKRFEPAQGTGSFRTSSQDGKTVYTTTFKAQDAQALASQLNDYLEEKDVTDTISLQHDPLKGIWPEYNLDADLSAIWELATGGVEESATFQVILPALHSGGTNTAEAADGTIAIEDSTGKFTVVASGPTKTTVWATLALIALAAIALVAALIWRKRTENYSRNSQPRNSTESTPYNVQGPQDDLTETQIFRSPLAPRSMSDTTSEIGSTDPLADPERTRIYDQTRPFPDVPIPSTTDYRESENRHDTTQHALDSDETVSNNSYIEDDSAGEDEQK